MTDNDTDSEELTGVVLDLFAGTGGFSAAFEDSDDWEVVRLELQDRFDSDLQGDIRDYSPNDIREEIITQTDVNVWRLPDDRDFLFVILASRHVRRSRGRPSANTGRRSRTESIARRMKRPRRTGIPVMSVSAWSNIRST